MPRRFGVIRHIYRSITEPFSRQVLLQALAAARPTNNEIDLRGNTTEEAAETNPIPDDVLN